MRKYKVGVIGVGRGSMLFRYCKDADNVQLCAICDFWVEGLEKAKREINDDSVFFCTSYDELLEQDLDGILLANYATEHAPFAIKAMEKGMDVISEVLPAVNMAEAVALIECVERTGKKYCYAENYCYMGGPREMKKLYEEGKLGEFEYGEGEYMHNCEPIWHEITRGVREHWRNNISAFFYCTHSLGPLLHITGLRPARVYGAEMPVNKRIRRMGSLAGHSAVELVTLENGAVIKSLHGLGCAKNSIWYTVYGSLGRIETAREDAEQGDITRVYRNLDSVDAADDGRPVTYLPTDAFTEVGKKHGHGGSDYVCLYNIFEHLNGREADIVDVYEAVDMWMPGHFGYLSAQQGGIALDIPDLRDPAQRDAYRYDTRCTIESAAGEQFLPPYTKGSPVYSDDVYDYWKEKWEKHWAEQNKQPEPQLIMHWKHDGEEAVPPTLPDDVRLERLSDRETGIDDWLDIVQHGLTNGRQDEDCYRRCMEGEAGYSPDRCFFLTVDGVPAATAAVLCNYETNAGYIHMVACKPEYRGRGLGNLLNEVCVYTLKKEGMQTAYLTTDDWRIPAIRSYLRYGLTPELSTENFKARWQAIFEKIEALKVEFPSTP